MPGGSDSSPTAISGDGSVDVGGGTSGVTIKAGFRWIERSGKQPLPACRAPQALPARHLRWRITSRGARSSRARRGTRGMKHGIHILRSIGGTPVVELRSVVPGGCARVLVKLESHNPTGSMKDRMARSVVDGAVASGRLSAVGTVVEYTGGSTGTSLAFVCAARGIPVTLVTSDAFSREKRDHMRALGADVVELPSEGGKTTRELIRRMMAEAAELSAAPGAWARTAPWRRWPATRA